MKRFYVDTCIWIDYFENRKDKFRPLGEWAFKFFRTVNENNWTIIISDFVIKELRNRFNELLIKEIFKVVKNKKIVSCSKQEFIEGLKLSKDKHISKYDGIHAIIARNYEAILITRDKHFIELNELIKVNKPEDLI